MRNYLVKLREKNGLTQQNVADKLGISRQYYAMVENGERQNKMDITLVTKLSTVFHIALTDFITAETNWQEVKDFEINGKAEAQKNNSTEHPKRKKCWN